MALPERDVLKQSKAIAFLIHVSSPGVMIFLLQLFHVVLLMRASTGQFKLNRDVVVYASAFCIPSLLHLSNTWFSALDFTFVSVVILHLVPSNDIVLKIHIFAVIYTY